MNARYDRELVCVLGLFALVWGGAGCRRSSAPSGGARARASSAPSSATKPTMTPEEEARFLGKTPEEEPLVLGPGPADMSSAEREQRLKQLLSGQCASERLPLVETATDVPHDPELHDRLAQIAVDRPAGTGLAGLE